MTNAAPVYTYFFNHTLEVVQVRGERSCRTGAVGSASWAGALVLPVLGRTVTCVCVCAGPHRQLFVPNKGCFHGSELFFVLDLSIALWTEGEKALADAFIDYWTNFAATGVPSGLTLPPWPAFTMVSV